MAEKMQAPEGVKQVLEIVFLKELGSHAYILVGGEIHLQLILGECFSKEEFLQDDQFQHAGKKQIENWLDCYEKIEAYYKFHYTE